MVEELERQIYAILDPRTREALRRRKLAVTEENVLRLFGISFWELFELLAKKFGYEIQDETTLPK